MEERRRSNSAERAERRRTQRRTPLTAAELDLWETIGFRLIPPPVLVFHNPVLS